MPQNSYADRRFANRFKLTRAGVDALRPTGAQKTYWDTELRGFGICVNANSKTYLVQRTVGSKGTGGRKTIKMTIGRHGVFSIDDARREARELLAKFARAEDPRADKKKKTAHSITLREAWARYRPVRNLRPQTSQDYTRAIELHLARWLDRPLCQISGTEVVDLYAHLSDPKSLGPTVTAKTFRIFRAIYNFAEAANEALPPNPANRLTKMRMWHRDRRRTGHIRPDQMPSWYEAVMNLPSEAARDYLRLILFTGMRRSEAAGLKWENVDFGRRVFTVPVTKNGDPLVLPMSTFVFNLFEQRRAKNPMEIFVFPSESLKGFLQEPKKWVAQVSHRSGVSVTLHDLRRTFATVAESVNVGQRTIQRLLNHRPGREALTNYIVFEVEQLREPIERIGSYLDRAIFKISPVHNLKFRRVIENDIN